MKLTIKNYSSADSKFLKEFYFELENLPKKLADLINKKKIKIILADKFSDIATNETLKEIKKYKENYNPNNINKTIRGICSDDIEGGSICIFYNNAKDSLPVILYHEIGHLVDYYTDFENPSFSIDKNFVEAYKKDLTLNWSKIKTDKRFKLMHYIQDSTPNNPSKSAMIETFAFCFAKNFNKIDTIDIVSEYFENSFNTTKKIIEQFFCDF